MRAAPPGATLGAKRTNNLRMLRNRLYNRERRDKPEVTN